MNEKLEILIDDLYNELRNLVKDNVIISFHDRETHNLHCTVALEFQGNNCHWTRFEGKDLVDAFERALDKLKHPEKDYLDITGHLWEADDSSCFHKPYIESFLRESEAGRGQKK